jgi:hypothetical protein
MPIGIPDDRTSLFDGIHRQRADRIGQQRSDGPERAAAEELMVMIAVASRNLRGEELLMQRRGGAVGDYL